MTARLVSLGISSIPSSNLPVFNNCTHSPPTPALLVGLRNHIPICLTQNIQCILSFSLYLFIYPSFPHIPLPSCSSIAIASFLFGFFLSLFSSLFSSSSPKSPSFISALLLPTQLFHIKRCLKVALRRSRHNLTHGHILVTAVKYYHSIKSNCTQVEEPWKEDPAMTNTADNVSSSNSKPARVEPGGNPPSNPNKANSSATATQKSDIGFLQDSRPHSIHHHPEDPTYVRHNGRGLPPATLSMGGMRSALPGYRADTVVFDRRVMPQRFVPTGPGHGVVYSSMHPLPLFLETTPNMNMPVHNPFSQAYSLYSQEQQQQQQQEHMPSQHTGPGYQPLGYSSPTHLGIPPAEYGQIYYAPPTYVASHGHSAVQANVTIHLHQNCPSKNTQENFAKASTTLSKGSKSRTPESGYDVSKTIVDGSTPMRSTQTPPSAMGKQKRENYAADLMAHGSPLSRTDIHLGGTAPHPINLTRPITPRGPPRKPKQSGHALWVGNLPPGTDINELKDYFARDATKDVESVFLISKSNCAFVNYKTEVACLAALSRFHDTRFHGARLVCRLRRDSISSAPQPDSSSCSSQAENGADAIHNEQNESMLVKKIVDSTYSSPRMPNRYFIVKSLSMDDLELSRQSGIWATQAHNEGNLNHAYQTADNVYLVFSANKSGEYYGYARMVSPIQEDDGLIMEMLPRPNHIQAESEDLDLTPTPATSTAPNGRIINDLARGTVFWEADSSEDEGGRKIAKSVAEVAEEVAESGFQSIGKPFRIQWLSTERVPFYRTRGLRNPWNANREIKIARDGTEIEPAVGERLVQLFHTPYVG